MPSAKLNTIRPVHNKRHSVFKLEYHLVLVTRYRHPVIRGAVKEFLYSYIEDYFRKNDFIALAEINGEEDHIHLLFETEPNINLSTLINSLKTASSRMVRKNFPKELDSYYWKPYFWSHSYFLATVSERNTEAVNKHIENQGVHNKKEAHVSRH